MMDDLEDFEKVIVHLLFNNGVFYASLLSQMHRVADKTMPFMAGVTIINGRIELRYNPKLFSEHTKNLNERRAVLEHECLHLVMDHLTRIRSRHPQLWNIATDLAINQMIKDLPDGVVTMDKFSKDWNLKSNAIAEYYYDVMYKHQPRIKFSKKSAGKCGRCGGTGKEPKGSQGDGDSKNKQQQQSGNGGGKGTEKKDQQKGQSQGQGQGKDQKDQQQGQGQGQGQKDEPCQDCGGKGMGETTHVDVYDDQGNKTGEFDLDKPGNHDKWEKGDSPDIASEVLRQSVAAAKEQTERSQGRIPGGLEQYIDELLKPPILPWWRLLKQFVATKIKSGSKRSWKRPNRRFGEDQKGKLPDRKLRIIEVVDTSGSINMKDYQDFTAEMQGLQRIYKTKVTIIECDWDIQRVYELIPNKKVDTKFHGGGGTSFKPPFKYIADKRLNPDLVIYFTDMYGDFPSQKPPYPVLWVSVSDVDTAPFGQVLAMQKHKPKDYGDW
ncbi:MAG: VWA-like domain-containing protein [Thermodesulfobacteriota bacterium]